MLGETIQITLEGKLYHNSKCKYCGKPFNRGYNSEKYCSDECRHKALQDQKATYQRKRRRLIREGHIISNETRYVGTNFLSQHRQKDFKDEYRALQKEMKRMGLK